MDFTDFKQRIFHLNDISDFNGIALELFRYQYQNCAVYHEFVKALHIDIEQIKDYKQIPFLPVSFFKTHNILTGDASEQIVFESSGTTGMVPSRHFVADIDLYNESFSRGFEIFYGDLNKYEIFALLPSYLEREHSSLVFMVEKLLQKTNRKAGGFYLNNLISLQKNIFDAYQSGAKILLIGVTFALLDMAENFPVHLPEAIIIETGGMKGRRDEITRMELHENLCKGFGVRQIHSEYGMTELLSQAWSLGNGLFRCPPWMKVLIADTNDPLGFVPTGRSGGINVIDLANAHSCSFIATQDLGRIYEDGSFEVLGRFDSSDIRGCSLLAL